MTCVTVPEEVSAARFRPLPKERPVYVDARFSRQACLSQATRIKQIVLGVRRANARSAEPHRSVTRVPVRQTAPCLLHDLSKMRALPAKIRRQAPTRKRLANRPFRGCPRWDRRV